MQMSAATMLVIEQLEEGANKASESRDGRTQVKLW